MSSSVSPLPLHKVAQSKQNRLPLNAEVRIVKGNHKGELGVLRYFGFVRFAWGTDPLKDKWVGVALHAPHGRHDGKVSGVRYFRCQAKHGVFVRGRASVEVEGTSLAPFIPPPLISPVSSPRVEPQVRAAALADSSDEEDDDEVLLVREHEGVRGRRSGRRDERDEGDDVQDGVGLRVDASTDAAPSAGASTLASRRGTLTISVDTSSLDARVGGGAPSPRSPRSPLSPSSPGSDISPVLERAHRRTQSMKEKFDRKAKRKRMRERIMGEIISTERRYVESMGLAVSKFYEPLRELAQAGKIDEEKVHTMFSNIEQLVAFHHLFLEQLSKEENHNVGGMATAFLRYSDYLRMYTIYVNNHEAAIRAYTSLVNSSKRFQSFLEKAGRDPELRGMQLASFLIMPVQRIPRYQLLLSSLAKHSEPDPVQNVPQAHRNAVSNPSSPVPQTQLATLRQQQSKHSSPERGKQPLTPSGTESDTGSGRTGSLKRRSLEQSLERSRRLSVQHADEISAGPLARLEMALAKIREIATFVNERKREEESIEFTVMKVNRLNSNTPRLFELDIKRKQLIIAKHSKNAGSEPFADRDLVLTPECFDRIKLSNKLREKITFWFFPPGASRLLRKKKEWKLLFSDHGARQRFFHLTQVHFMTRRSQAGERGYTYEPQPLAVSNEMHLQVQELPVQALAEELHSVWVQEKQKQGFCFGPQVDNKLRTHPGLVAFDELHESERRRDVQAAEDLLASILALGFRIRKASQEEEARVGGPIERELWELVEYLAETAHDSWAEGKMRDGWTYGPERDDVNKKHPGLVAYCDLASVEQDFDRHAAENVLTTLIELGYVVEKRAVSAMPQNEAEG